MTTDVIDAGVGMLRTDGLRAAVLTEAVLASAERREWVEVDA